MKSQDLLSLKLKKKSLVSSAAVVIGILRIKSFYPILNEKIHV